MLWFFVLALFNSPSTYEGLYRGTIDIPGQPLAVEITLKAKGNKWVAMITIPSQGLVNMNMRTKLKNNKLKASMVGIPGDPIFSGTLQNDSYSGTFSQGNASFPFKLDKTNPKGSVQNPKKTGPPAVANHPALGHWEGLIHIPDSPGLGVIIDLTFDQNSYLGNVQFPSQTAQKFPLSEIYLGTEKVSFKVPSLPGTPRFTGQIEAGKLQGEFQQANMKTRFELSREALEKPKRPQTPKPPFPYRSESFSWQNGKITLAGTLTYPQGEGPFPAVILLSGSGSQDRDSTLFAHKPFWVLADYLTRQGFAVLRYDDRGVGGSTPDANATSADFAKDAIEGLKALSKLPQINAQKMGLIGHSEGGIIAPLAASQSALVSFMVSLAGPGVPGSQIIRYQIGRQMEPLYHSQQRADFYAEFDKVLHLTGKAETVEQAWRQSEPILKSMYEALPASSSSQVPYGEFQKTFSLLFNPWTLFFLDHDPSQSLKASTIPTLVLLGSLDLQVTTIQNQEPITKALSENPKATVEVIAGVNHLFQPAKTGEGAEYSQIETTISPKVLTRLSDWLKKQTAP